MRLAILADIHGNLPALEAVIADFSSVNVDHVIVAGDAINWGPFSAQVVDIIHSKRWSVIRGNNEYYLLDFRTERAPEHWNSYTLLPWLHDQISQTQFNLIAVWPDNLNLRYPNAPLINILHGTPLNNAEAIFPGMSDSEIKGVFKNLEQSVVITAHSHIPMQRKLKKWHIINPGSVGVPLDGITRASYVILESADTGWIPTFRRVPYNVKTVITEFNNQRFEEQCGAIAHLVIREFETARLYVIPFLKWRTVNAPDEPISKSLINRFSEIDRINYLPDPYQGY